MKTSAMQSLAGGFLAATVLLSLCVAPAAAQRKPLDARMGPPSAVRPELAQPSVPVPECRYAGDEVHVDLSTTNNAWRVTGPAQTGLGGPTLTSYQSWTANNGYWVQPFSSSQINSSALSGVYTYRIAFDLPCVPGGAGGYASIALAGGIAADNGFQADLNGHPIAACSSASACLTSATQVSTQPSYFQQGQNVITVKVTNTPTSWNPKTGLMTGLAAKFTLMVQCGKTCCRELPPRPR